MDNWTDVPTMLRDVSASVLKIASVLTALALLRGEIGVALGFILGGLLSLWQLVSIANSAARLLQPMQHLAQTRAASSYIARYLLLAMILGMVYFTRVINFYATVAGLLLVKIVIVAKAVRQLLREGGIAYLREMATRQRRRGGD